MLEKLIIAAAQQLAAWLVGKPFFTDVLYLVQLLDGRIDLDGDGKKQKVIDELTHAGIAFGKRQINRAIELALIVVESKKPKKKTTETVEPGTAK